MPSRYGNSVRAAIIAAREAADIGCLSAENDCVIAWAAAAGGSPGIVVVSTTGSVAYGRNSDGATAVAGGYGHLLGNEGGGFDLGRSALVAALRGADGRGDVTRLTDLCMQRLNVSTPRTDPRRRLLALERPPRNRRLHLARLRSRPAR